MRFTSMVITFVITLLICLGCKQEVIPSSGSETKNNEPSGSHSDSTQSKEPTHDEETRILVEDKKEPLALSPKLPEKPAYEYIDENQDDEKQTAKLYIPDGQTGGKNGLGAPKGGQYEVSKNCQNWLHGCLLHKARFT